MKIHEHQAKECLRRFGVAVPDGRVARTADEAATAFSELAAPLAVVKAQIHAGGRGKGGGIQLVRSADEARAAAAKMLGKPLVTPQTGPKGRVVKTVLVEKGSAIEREFYAGIALDRRLSMPVFMASSEGGMEIEEVAAAHPEKILRETIDPSFGLQAWQARRLAFGIGIPGDRVPKATKLLQSLVRLYLDLDASIAEINPLVTTKDGSVLALDAKVNFDSNALFRHTELLAYRDFDEEDPKEVEASKYDLSYIALDGTIGCMVNGAGLAMATMDTIQLHGGRPANFLDVGGGTTKEKVSAAFKILVSDTNVRGILVNIFGGIAKCDMIAEGVVAAAREIQLSVPLVVRLEGTNVERGREILAASGLPITSAASLDEAAAKICGLVKKEAAPAKKGGRS
ncbi:MAG TPA: ADP-forming succinate--CoA ligase subunit beta [Planctomycetota bacterium]|nr:ADP-forming succinate--CoA ligase subunit beta [Planctomycetota bacterium]